MRIEVDLEKCQSHGRCYALAPALFEPDDLGYAVVRLAEVPPELLHGATLAADNCPEQAITILESRDPRMKDTLS